MTKEIRMTNDKQLAGRARRSARAAGAEKRSFVGVHALACRANKLKLELQRDGARGATRPTCPIWFDNNLGYRP